MLIRKYISTVITITLLVTLTGCGGSNQNNNNNPAPPQYGQLNSTIQFNFNSTLSQPINLQTQLINSGINAGLSTSRAATSNLANLTTNLGFNAENVSTNATSLGVNHVNAYAITYTTPPVDSGDTPRNVSGLVLVPTQANGAIINNPKGIVVFYHPTELAKNSTPSCLTPAIITNSPAYCHFNATAPSTYAGVSGDTYYTQLSAVYTAAGYIVVAPDYIGQGMDNHVIHPYVLFPAANADAGLYMVGAARDMLAAQNILPKSIPLNLFITGFSEGGGYALNAAQQAQMSLSRFLASQNVSLKITAPAEGVYDPALQIQFGLQDLMDGVEYCGLTNGNPTPCNPPSTLLDNTAKIVSTQIAAEFKPVLFSLSLTTLAYYGGVFDQTLFNPQFFNFSLIGSNPVQTVTLFQLFFSPDYSAAQITESIIFNAARLLNPDNNLPYGGGLSGPNAMSGMNNSVKAFVNPAILQNSSIATILTNAVTYKWKTTTPINFIHMNYDSVVSRANYDNAYSYMLQTSPSLINETTIANDSIANTDCESTTSNASVFCQANPFGMGNHIPLTHAHAAPFMYIGALCAFEHAQGLHSICS